MVGQLTHKAYTSNNTVNKNMKVILIMRGMLLRFQKALANFRLHPRKTINLLSHKINSSNSFLLAKDALARALFKDHRNQVIIIIIYASFRI